MSQPARARLFGREPELAILRALLDEPSERGSALVVRGDAGSGKSALLAEAGRHAEETGKTVLRATGVESEARMPFAGLHQLLRPVLGGIDDLSDVQRSALLNAFGSASGSSHVFLVALATLNLLGELASRQRVAVLVDDAQWLDAPTLEVLRFTARRVESDSITLVISCRDGFEGSLALSGAREFELRALDDEAAANLLDAQFPKLSRRARQQVLELAAGNPLALVELPSVLEKAPLEPGIDWLPLTSRLERAFARRMLDLPPATQSLLFVLSLDDRPSVSEILAAAAKLLDPPPTLDDLAPAESERLVWTDGRTVRFRHPLMRSAVREAATTAQRLAAHSALADVLGDQPVRSVWHRAACATGLDESIAVQLDATAAHLRQHHETAAALTALARAAELSGAGAGRGARLVAAAELALELGRNEEVVSLLDRAERLDLEARTRHSLRWLREALAEASGTGSVGSMVAVAEELAAKGEQRLAFHALFTAAVRCYMFKVDESISATVTRIADQLSLPADDPGLAAIYALASPSLRRRQILATAEGRTPEQIVGTSPDAGAAAEALHLYALALTSLAEFRIGVGFQDAAIARLRAQVRLGLLARALGSHSVTRVVLDDWRLASQAAEECLRLTGYVRGSPATATDGERVLNAGFALLVLGIVEANRGRSSPAEQLVDEAVQTMGWVGTSFGLAGIQAARASLALAAGRSAEAFQHVSRIFDQDDAAYHWGVSRWSTVLRDLADAALASGNVQTALALLATLDRTTISHEARATLAYVDAVLADHDVEERFRQAFAHAPTSVYFQARLQLAFGLWLRRERQQTEARTHLRSAIDGFEAMGAVPWAERARQELRASGETVRQRSPERREDLSPQETQIAQLAADGLTNREIGERLFLSHRTVGSHLYRMFPKLRITSRSELAAALKHVPG
jgi:DNA-binding CsgD family transcriptional regulator